MSGALTVIGLGPGAADLITPAATRVLAEATDLIGYGAYLDRIPEIRSGQTVHASDNRVELDRARHALTLAARDAASQLSPGAIRAFSQWQRRFSKPSRKASRRCAISTSASNRA